MKKIFLYIAITLGLLSCNHKDSLWQEVVEDLDERVETLEMLCAEMNTNIASLQTIVDVLQSNDFITSIVEIKKDGKVVGYTITFGKHDPITIYHGQNGKDGQNGQDGQNGADGKDGITPVIGVAQDTDGVYYWTLNGEWLLDDNGNKLPVSGKDGQNGTNGSNGQDGADGKDGQDGEDGKDGADGQDGKDGITPQLKIEEGYWYISYDNGATWTQLGKATGEDGKDGVDGEDGKDGQNGADGKDGQDGDSMFQSVTQDENYVYFTLADGTVIKIAKASEEEQPNSEFMFIVTYHANGGEGTMKPDTFYYGVSKQLSEITYTKDSHTFTSWNTKADGKGISYYTKQELMISKNITLYAQWEELYEYVDLGLSVKWATCNLGAEQPWEYGDYYAWGEVNTKSSYTQDNYKYGKESKMTKYCGSYTFGYQMFTDDLKTLEKEDDAAYQNKGDAWRIPTCAEIQELISSCTWTYTTLNGRNGYKVTSNKTGFTDRSIFLPCERTSNTVGYYWSSENQMGNNYADCASCLHFNNSTIEIIWKVQYRYYGYSIRPVCP